MTMEAILTKDLTKMYGKARGIIGLNLTVEKGELFGFIGPNGAGKLNLGMAAVGIAISAVGIIAAFVKYMHKDIQA